MLTTGYNQKTNDMYTTCHVTSKRSKPPDHASGRKKVPIEVPVPVEKKEAVEVRVEKKVSVKVPSRKKRTGRSAHRNKILAKVLVENFLKKKGPVPAPGISSLVSSPQTEN